jgi:hypothetical protein
MRVGLPGPVIGFMGFAFLSMWPELILLSGSAAEFARFFFFFSAFAFARSLALALVMYLPALQ